jgi:hypothetical protein
MIVVWVMIDGRGWAHEFWDIDGEIVGIGLEKGGFLNFAGAGVCEIGRRRGVIVRHSVGRIMLDRVHGGGHR